MKKFLVILALVCFQYNVQTGDTLDSIAHQYFSATNPNEFAALKEGIREVNYDVIGEGEVAPGMVLKIYKY